MIDINFIADQLNTVMDKIDKLAKMVEDNKNNSSNMEIKEQPTNVVGGFVIPVADFGVYHATLQVNLTDDEAEYFQLREKIYNHIVKENIKAFNYQGGTFDYIPGNQITIEKYCYAVDFMTFRRYVMSIDDVPYIIFAHAKSTFNKEVFDNRVTELINSGQIKDTCIINVSGQPVYIDYMVKPIEKQ